MKQRCDVKQDFSLLEMVHHNELRQAASGMHHK
jgi:hypothetical protein